jgi:hypothetical protein
VRKEGRLPAGLFLPLSIGFLAITLGSFPGRAQDQDQPDQPKFYAVQVISEKGVRNAKDALGAPDGRSAEILPGGQLILLMEKELYVIPVADQNYGVGLAYSGAMVAKGETPALLEAWILIRNAKGEECYDWISIGGGVPSPFYHGWPEGIARTNKVRITNVGTESLFVDAVIGLGTEPEKR